MKERVILILVCLVVGVAVFSALEVSHGRTLFGWMGQPYVVAGLVALALVAAFIAPKHTLSK
jgi:hypothetical protein